MKALIFLLIYLGTGSSPSAETHQITMSDGTGLHVTVRGEGVPVLFYFGSRDWMVGPEHYRMIEFPDLLLWPAETAHMPFLENQNDLLQAIRTFLENL